MPILKTTAYKPATPFGKFMDRLQQLRNVGTPIQYSGPVIPPKKPKPSGTATTLMKALGNLTVALLMISAGCTTLPNAELAFDPGQNLLALTLANGDRPGHLTVIRSNETLYLSFAAPTNATRSTPAVVKVKAVPK